MDTMYNLEATQWDGPFSQTQQNDAIAALENGNVVYLPRLNFIFAPEEQKFLAPVWSNGTAKNISYDHRTGRIQGVEGKVTEQRELATLLRRYSDQTRTLLHALFPHYKSALLQMRTSFRPVEIKGRASKITRDDTRLHPDQFPARPVGGWRIIRVFCNVNPDGRGRQWRLGEPLADFAGKFASRLRAPVPGSRQLMYWLRITRSPRTVYDHYMKQLHDLGKMDDHYQKTAPQSPFCFPAHCTWLCFTDQLLHAVDAGQYLLEQTYLLPVEAMHNPEKSPLRVLEGMLGQTLV